MFFCFFYFLENLEETSSPNDLQSIPSDVHPPSTIRCYIPEQHAGQGFISLVLNPCFQYTNPPIMSHTIHVWYIYLYLHFVDLYGKYWKIYQSHGSYVWWCCNSKALKMTIATIFWYAAVYPIEPYPPSVSNSSPWIWNQAFFRKSPRWTVGNLRDLVVGLLFCYLCWGMVELCKIVFWFHFKLSYCLTHRQKLELS